ncbi:hypothetical protein [Solibacillus sp. CAU 1738]|uniref:hypothetical protein n=1 Tax=Solibacillus sp. CAU 1738 TaxID=3140363 RepID=UPI003261592A
MLETILVLSFFLNPICALIFSLNLCFLILKAAKGDFDKVKINIISICISFVFIIFSLTWLFTKLPEA